ncbi:MAG: hypothetical protein KatS3mg105_4565 [Gemmatales bacterium]|nr:MAG: hypothetical protein KatS3mg105_4565 [Gemmatales bacterium]
MRFGVCLVFSWGIHLAVFLLLVPAEQMPRPQRSCLVRLHTGKHAVQQQPLKAGIPVPTPSPHVEPQPEPKLEELALIDIPLEKQPTGKLPTPDKPLPEKITEKPKLTAQPPKEKLKPHDQRPPKERRPFKRKPVKVPPIATGAIQTVPDDQGVRTKLRQPDDIRRYFHYPEYARIHQIEGTVILHLHISATGKVVEAKIHRSSGVDILDRAAVRDVYKVPFVMLVNEPVRDYEFPVRYYITRE